MDQVPRLWRSRLNRCLLLALLCGLGASLCPATAGAHGTGACPLPDGRLDGDAPAAGQAGAVTARDTTLDSGAPFSARDRRIGLEMAETDRSQSARPMAVCLGLSVMGLALVGGVIGYVVRRDSRALAPALEAGYGSVCRRCGARLEPDARSCHGCRGAV